MTAPPDRYDNRRRYHRGVASERDAALSEKAALAEELAARTAELPERKSEFDERIEYQAATLDVLKAMSPRPAIHSRFSI